MAPEKVRCPKCGIESGSTAELCYNCGASLRAESSVPVEAAESPRATAASVARVVKPGNSLTRRYADAYVVSRTIVALGNTIKTIGYVIGGLIAISGLLAATQTQSSVAVLAVISGLLTGAFVGVTFVVAGILLSAQGQILAATLDTAVNTSAFLSADEMRQVMSID